MTDIPYSRPSFVYNNHRIYYIPNHSYNAFGTSSNFIPTEYLNNTRNVYGKTDDFKSSRRSLENERTHTNYSDINGFKKYYEKSYEKSIQSDLKRSTLAENTLNYQKNIIKPLSHSPSVSRNYSTYNYRKPIFPSENILIRNSDYIRKPAVPPRPSLYERNSCEKVPLVPERNHSLKTQYINKETTNSNETVDNNFQNSKEFNYQQIESVCNLRNSEDYSDLNTSQKNSKSTNTHNSCCKNDEVYEITEKLSDLNFTSISCQEDNDIDTNEEVNLSLSFDLANLKPVSTIERHARIIQWIHASSDFSHFPPTDDIITDISDDINDELTKRALCV